MPLKIRDVEEIEYLAQKREPPIFPDREGAAETEILSEIAVSKRVVWWQAKLRNQATLGISPESKIRVEFLNEPFEITFAEPTKRSAVPKRRLRGR